MKAVLTARDHSTIRRSLDSANELQIERVAELLVPALEAVDTNLSRQLEDLSQDTGMGFAEVHGKIEYLRGEINEIKTVLNSLFR